MGPVTASGTAVVTPVGDRQIRITREFNAPRNLVWRAWTTPELVERWWTAGRAQATTVENDLRVGGKWRYVMVSDGVEIAFHGENREIVPHERLVSTEVFEGIPDAEANASLNTMTLTDLDGGRTRLEILVEHATPEGRDMHLASGMEVGLQDALDLLEQIAVSLG